MKKSHLIILFSSIILSSCTPESGNIPIEIPIVEQPKFTKCDELAGDEKDFCLYSYISSQLYNPDYNETSEDYLCESMTSKSWGQAECYWLFAMKFKDEKYCEFLPASLEEVATHPPSGNFSNEYALKPRCQSELNFQHEGASWKLTEGFAPWADPVPLFYEGKAELRGWIVYVPAYVGDPEAHFHIAEEDRDKLPPSLQHKENFLLENVTNEKMAELETFSESNPATILAKSIHVNIEGSPLLKIED